MLAAHSEKRGNKKEGGKSQPITWEEAIVHYLKVVCNIHQHLDGHMIKCIHLWSLIGRDAISHWGRMPFHIEAKFWVIKKEKIVYFEHQKSLETSVH